VAAAVFVLLRLVASGMMTIASRAPRFRSTVLRMAVANIHRPAALTPSIVLSLGLGIALLVTVIVPFNVPALAGSKITPKVEVWPTPNVTGALAPLSE